MFLNGHRLKGRTGHQCKCAGFKKWPKHRWRQVEPKSIYLAIYLSSCISINTAIDPSILLSSCLSMSTVASIQLVATNAKSWLSLWVQYFEKSMQCRGVRKWNISRTQCWGNVKREQQQRWWGWGQVRKWIRLAPAAAPYRVWLLARRFIKAALLGTASTAPGGQGRILPLKRKAAFKLMRRGLGSLVAEKKKRKWKKVFHLNCLLITSLTWPA